MPPDLRFRLLPELRPILHVGLVRAYPVRIGPAGPALQAEIDRLSSELAERYEGRSPGEIPGLGPARELYKAFGIDPTRTRPSSEALLRRVLRSRPFPRILNAVDVGNLCSLSFLLPLGLYDLDRIEGAVALRRGKPAEHYVGIRKDRVNLGGRPVLADERGPFGNPTSDSLRTSVDARTRSLWMVIFAPRSVAPETLAAHAGTASELISRHLGVPGTPVESSVDVAS